MGCYNATVLNAPADSVWETLRNFHDVSWAPNVVESVTAVGDVPGTQVGAKRILNNAFHETLREIDEQAHYLKYSIDDGPGPVAKDAVTGYLGEVKVIPITVPGTGQTVVVWSSRWDTEQGGVHEFCDPIYRALLTDLKSHFG